MKLLIVLLITSSVVVSCANVERPDTDLCVVNAPAGHQKCYNLKRDYNNDGKRRKDAAPKFKPAKSIDDLNKSICTDADGFANLKAFVNELRAASSNQGRRGD
jgi:hypothetical protein